MVVALSASNRWPRATDEDESDRSERTLNSNDEGRQRELPTPGIKNPMSALLGRQITIRTETRT